MLFIDWLNTRDSFIQNRFLTLQGWVFSLVTDIKNPQEKPRLKLGIPCE